MLRTTLLAAMAGLLMLTYGAANAVVKIRVQSVLPTKADEIVMVKDFAANVAALTGGEVQIEVLPDGAIVSGRELYNQLWDEMDLNIKDLMLQPVGPESLGLVQRANQQHGRFPQIPFPHSAGHSRANL